MMQTAKTSAKKSAVIVNGEGLILGRMCSKIAKSLLNGEQVIVVNAEKIVISGKKKVKVAEAHKFLEVGAPERGPFHSRRPDRIVRKTVRGMVPWRQPKGKTAYKRLKVYLGIPAEFKDLKMETYKEADASKLTGPNFTLGEFAVLIGWNQGA
ncbi:MAG: 50S ribosomal protein L13 [Candidatus Bathyarchaeota archaeon]|nr:50S ribosomal protein L13 [Candidatus Bathyarchaeota archaeon]